MLFFALQVLPHQITRLQGAFSFLYPVVAAFLFFVIGTATIVTAIMWISAHDSESRLQRRSWFLTFALMLIVGILCSFAAAAYARGLPTGSFVKQFDQHLWLSASSQNVSGEITDRQKMLGDVVRKVVVNGTKDNIVAQLGPSEDSEYFESTGRDLIYWTGPQRDSPFAIDSEWLLIWVDPNGRVSRYEILSD